MTGSATPDIGLIRELTRAIRNARNGKDEPISAYGLSEDAAVLVREARQLICQSRNSADLNQRIITDVSHDFKTPITAIRGELEVALRSERSVAEYRRVIESCLQEVERLNYICESLMQLLRLQNASPNIEVRPTPVANLLLEEVAAARRLHREHHFEYDPGDCAGRTIEVDAKLVSLAVSHLLQNGAQHTEPGTVVRMTCSSYGELVIKVEDNGVGLPEEEIRRLTDSFYRSDEARGRQTGAGAGLGLAIANGVAQVHGGQLDVGSSRGGGLSVRITLPG